MYSSSVDIREKVIINCTRINFVDHMHAITAACTCITPRHNQTNKITTVSYPTTG